MKNASLGGGWQSPTGSENTGALSVLAFEHEPRRDSKSVDVWVCVSPEEEDVLESAIGEIILEL